MCHFLEQAWHRIHSSTVPSSELQPGQVSVSSNSSSEESTNFRIASSSLSSDSLDSFLYFCFFDCAFSSCFCFLLSLFSSLAILLRSFSSSFWAFLNNRSSLRFCLAISLAFFFLFFIFQHSQSILS